MPRFMVSMPDEMLKKLDRLAREEHRSRSELLREAVRRHLAAPEPTARETSPASKDGKEGVRRRWTRKALEQYLLTRGVVAKGCPGLDLLVGPVKGPVEMKRILNIGKKLTGLSHQIIEDREDRM